VPAVIQCVEDRRTARLRLRRIVDADVPELVAITADPAANVHRPGGAPDLAQSEEIVRDFIDGWAEEGLGFWVVEHDGAIVGIAGVRPFRWHGRDCWNLYYRFAPASWGHGFATEAAREAVAVARSARPVLARTQADNGAAIKVALAAGLERRPDLDGEGFVVYATG
jgi:[ribosomal protein S5]-alanine N-acetyltransferase